MHLTQFAGSNTYTLFFTAYIYYEDQRFSIVLKLK